MSTKPGELQSGTFCGHGAQLRALKRAFGVEPVFGKEHGAVVVVEVGDAALMAVEGA